MSLDQKWKGVPLDTPRLTSVAVTLWICSGMVRLPELLVKPPVAGACGEGLTKG